GPVAQFLYVILYLEKVGAYCAAALHSRLSRQEPPSFGHEDARATGPCAPGNPGHDPPTLRLRSADVGICLCERDDGVAPWRPAKQSNRHRKNSPLTDD